MNNTTQFSFEEYKNLVDDYCGICLKCNDVADGVEPDAEGYECQNCGAHKVVGIELAYIMGEIEVDDSEVESIEDFI